MRYDCLIVDDEKELADNTRDYLNMYNINTYACYSKEDYTNFFKENNASLVLLDINLEDGSGFDICKEIRETKDIPILFISARNLDDDKIIALTIGGDDYIEKPYSLGVLLAKIKATLKKYNKKENEIYDDGNLKESTKKIMQQTIKNQESLDDMFEKIRNEMNSKEVQESMSKSSITANQIEEQIKKTIEDFIKDYENWIKKHNPSEEKKIEFWKEKYKKADHIFTPKEIERIII